MDSRLYQQLDVHNLPNRGFVTSNKIERQNSTSQEPVLPTPLLTWIKAMDGRRAVWDLNYIPDIENLPGDRIVVMDLFSFEEISVAWATWPECKENRVVPIFDQYYVTLDEPILIRLDYLLYESNEEANSFDEFMFSDYASKLYFCWDGCCPTDNMHSHLILAACKGETDTVLNACGTSKDYDEPLNDDGWTLLSYAVEYNQIQLAELLLKRGADPNRAITLDSLNGKGESTILARIARLGLCHDIAELLLKTGADPNPPTPGDFPLFGFDPRGQRLYSENLRPLLEKYGHKSATLEDSWYGRTEKHDR